MVDRPTGTISARTFRIVAVGDELIGGRTLDTNGSWLSRFAFGRGWTCVGMQQVGDDPQEMRAALDAAVVAAPLVLVTGGLGPTVDDRTRQILAEWANVSLVEDPEAWQQVQAIWRERVPDQPMPDCNRQQALKPEGAEIVKNDRGTAPGIFMEHGGSIVAAMPGVPHEMRGLSEKVFARLAGEKTELPSCRTTFAGLGESSLQELLAELSEDTPHCRVGVYCHDAGHLEVVTVGRDAPQRDALIRERCAEYVLPDAGLAKSVLYLAKEKGVQVATAESCTGGAIASSMTVIPGASAVFVEGLVTYTEAAKTTRLGVPPELIAEHGVVSEAVARAMAEGLAQAHPDGLAIATTGYAGPDGGTEADPVGTVYFAVRYQGQTYSRRMQSPGERVRIVGRATAKALLLALHALEGRA